MTRVTLRCNVFFFIPLSSKTWGFETISDRSPSRNRLKKYETAWDVPKKIEGEKTSGRLWGSFRRVWRSSGRALGVSIYRLHVCLVIYYNVTQICIYYMKITVLCHIPPAVLPHPIRRSLLAQPWCRVGAPCSHLARPLTSSLQKLRNATGRCTQGRPFICTSARNLPSQAISVDELYIHRPLLIIKLWLLNRDY